MHLTHADKELAAPPPSPWGGDVPQTMPASNIQICPECHQGFVPYNSRKNVIFCSYPCQASFSSRSRREARQAVRLRTPCMRCGVEFECVTSQKYCSTECAAAARAVRLVTITHLVCANCGADFRSTRSRVKFCSPRCRQEGKRARQKSAYSPERQATYAKKYRQGNNMAVRRSRYKNWYGISLDVYDALLANQGGKCAICHTHLVAYDRNTHLDHDHGGEGRIRGVLCSGCNVGLGRFQDDPERLRAAAAYIVNHKAAEVPIRTSPRGGETPLSTEVG